MCEWTEAARASLNQYLDRVRSSLKMSETEAGEVMDDLRRHVDEEVAAAGLQVVTGEDIQRITRKLGLPESVAQGPLPEAPRSSPAPDLTTASPLPFAGGWRWALLFIFGVLVPGITLGVELFTGMCAATFFDPLPTLFHVLLVAAVPVANFLALRALGMQETGSLRWLGWANGLALGVTAYYAFKFLPMAPFGFVAIVYMGFGLLPCSPLLALISTVLLRVRLRRLARHSAQLLPTPWPGLAVAVLALLVLNAPVWVTRLGLQWAASHEPAREQRGLHLLRTLGHQESLLRACYGRGAGAAGLDPVEWFFDGPPPSPDHARTIYYRVTGRAFNTVPAPRVRTARGVFAELNDWTWDQDQGGERVGGRIKDLSLHSSRLDATFEPEAALAYAEWTMEFKNDGPNEQEARAQIQLPTGAVVSRLTLWVNGEEREAAFAGRSQVREAYQSVAIRQRRDPVLVNTCGPDRILMQCFPVPRNGGTIKIRMGFTAPLALDADGQGRWLWPVLLERNFNLYESLRHTVWVQSPQPLASDTTLFVSGPKPHSLQGRFRDAELTSPTAAVRVSRDVASTVAWTRDTRAAQPTLVRQVLAKRPPTQPSRLVVVIDGSSSMKESIPEIADVLEAVRGERELTGVVVATDEPTWILPARAEERGAGDWIARLRRTRFRGGHDNVPALLAAWDATGGADGSMVVWIHGPQPVDTALSEALHQRWERNGSGVTLVSLPTVPGPNVLLQKLDGLRGARAYPRHGTLAEDLRRLLIDGHPEGSAWQRVLDLVETVPTGTAMVETSLHLARLWAHQEVGRLHRARQFGEATLLAARYQLVTAVTGAVVLETAQQFADHDLTPVDPLTVPSIPEPGPGVLLLLGLAVLALKRRRPALPAAPSHPTP